MGQAKTRQCQQSSAKERRTDTSGKEEAFATDESSLGCQKKSSRQKITVEPTSDGEFIDQPHRLIKRGAFLARLHALERVGGKRDAAHIGKKLMKDFVVRGCLLQLLYERRSEGFIPFGHVEQAVPPPGGINRSDWLRALAQLSEYRLIDWTPLEEKSGTGLLSGFAKINDLGVKVLEADVAPPIRIFIDKRRRTTVARRQKVPIGASTPQQEAITQALENVITAINQADVSEQEKMEARSLLRKLLRSKAAASVLGARAQSLAAKYFTQ